LITIGFLFGLASGLTSHYFLRRMAECTTCYNQTRFTHVQSWNPLWYL